MHVWDRVRKLATGKGRFRDPRHGFPSSLPLARLLSLVERHAAAAALSSEVAGFLQRLRPLEQHEHLSADTRKLVQRLDDLLGHAVPVLPDPGEPWADAVAA